LSEGHLQQVGTPEEIYEQPQSRFVADFIGESNLLVATVTRVDGGVAEFELAGLGSVHLNSADHLSRGQQVTLSVRPERIALSRSNGQCRLGPATVFDRTYLGNAVEYH
ncbi:TOBE domain-containing protein, partial [Escherichia coli]|nr:TOBE domain-containing protein [Escherichia coli]